MASALNLTASPNFPQGTSIAAYPRRFWAGKAPEPGEVGRGTPAATAVVDSHGYALFSGLESGETFYCGALVSGAWRWKTAQTPAPESGGGEGGSGTVTSINGVNPNEAGAIALPGLVNPNGQLPSKVVTSAAVTLGSVTGAVAIDLTAGRVFKGTMTGNVVPAKPTGFEGTGRLYFELEFAGNHTIDMSFLKGWRYGGPPDLTGATSPTNLQCYTDDGTNFYGVGAEGLPEDVPRVGTVADGQLLSFNASTGKYNGVVPPTGLSLAAVEGLLNELGIPHFPSGVDLFPLSNAEGIVGWEEFTAQVLTKALGRLSTTPAAITKTETLAPVGDRRYRITKKEIIVTLPLAFVTAGAMLVFENASTGFVTLSSRFTFESETVTSKVLQPGEIVTLYSDANALHYYELGRSRQAGDVTAPDINTTGKTSNQITKAYEESFSPEKPPRDTSIVVDNTNHLLLEYDGTLKKWFKSAALTEIT